MSELVRATLIRVARQFCFTAVGCIGGATLFSEVDWGMVLSACAISCIVTALTCIGAGLPEVESADELTDEDVEAFEEEDEEDDVEEE